MESTGSQELDKHLRDRTIVQCKQDPSILHAPTLERWDSRCQCVMGTGAKLGWAVLPHAPSQSGAWLFSAGCEGLWDNMSCWPSSAPARMVEVPCPKFLQMLTNKNGNQSPQRTLARGCNGFWMRTQVPEINAGYQCVKMNSLETRILSWVCKNENFRLSRKEPGDRILGKCEEG